MPQNLLLKIKSLKFARFTIIGILNTIIGTAVMFFVYNVLNLGYWTSSAFNYIVGSVFSYFANKYFTFESKQKSLYEVIRFIVNISVCYILAYGLAEVIIKNTSKVITPSLSASVIDQITMVVGICLFICFNFLGQSKFVFMKKENYKERKDY